MPVLSQRSVAPPLRLLWNVEYGQKWLSKQTEIDNDNYWQM